MAEEKLPTISDEDRQRLLADPSPEAQTLLELLEITEWEDMKRVLCKLAAARGEWAGYPIPVEGAPLVMEPRFPYPGLNCQVIENNELKRDVSRLPVRVVNSWYSHKRSINVVIYEVGGKRFHNIYPQYGAKKVEFWLTTLGAADAWSIASEERALQKLRGLVSERQYKQYILTGSFLETSQRSKVTYVFRKLRPTIALKADGDGMKILATLCMHPLGYYQKTWAGVLCPTDDVIAHYLYMKGNERGLWAKSNIHPLWEAEAGL